MIKINEMIEKLAKDEFSTDTQIIKKGLDVFYKYTGMDNIHEFLLENKLDDILARAMDDLDMTKDEVLYLAFDSYLNFVLDMTLAQRLRNIKVGEYVYNFSSLTCRKVFKEPTVHDILEQNRLDLIAEQEAIIDNGIAKANKVLDSKTLEINEVDKVVSDISKQLSKINIELTTLKAKSLISMSPSQRAKNRREIDNLQAKSITLIKDLEIAKDELKQLKNERFYIQEDISDMVKLLENPNSDGFYDVGDIKDQYR